MQFLFCIIFYLLLTNVNAQTRRIDSIKKELPGSTGKAEVDNLNAIAKEYHFYWVHADSSLKYVNLAFQKATLLNYHKGRAEAQIIRSGVTGRLLGRPGEMEKYAKEAIQILSHGQEPKTLAMAYYHLGTAYALQGRYEDAYLTMNASRQKAIDSKDSLTIGWAEEGIGFVYFKNGKYWKGFKHLEFAQQTGKKFNDSLLTSLSLAIIARAFNLAGDHRIALRYYHEAFQYAVSLIKLWSHHEDMAYAHLQLRQYDSAKYYQSLNTYIIKSTTADIKVQKKFLAGSRGYSVDIQLAEKKYDSVLIQVLAAMKQLKPETDVVPYMQSLFILGKVYQAKGDYPKSLRYVRELKTAANKYQHQRLISNAYQLLASLFEHMKMPDSAYKYFKQFTVLKDSMEIAQFANRTELHIAASEAESEIRSLKKDNDINEQLLFSNKKELERQAELKNLLITGIFILSFFFILVARNYMLKRKNEKLTFEHVQSTLKRKTLELEMQALRAQMNPHFIFNCLSAIDNLIQTSQADKATTYLARFAKLIRGVLDSSKNNVVSFQKDFETLQLYLEMEQFRCNNKFRYKLAAVPALLNGDYKIPPLIIQPFIENAIHHGLLNKPDPDRLLEVSAVLNGEHIIYSIIDNGVGRSRAEVIKCINRPDQKSYGMEITRDRVHLYNNENWAEDDVHISDLHDNGHPSGTKATIRINSFET